MPIKAILTDIEGTTSAVSFVFDVLFPYAARHLPQFILDHAEEPVVAAQLDAVRAESGEGGADLIRVIEILLQWLAEDRKATPLKALQGMVWQQGYASGQLKGHVYPDAVEALKRWHQAGYALYVYSSGSVQAQKLLFAHTAFGDLTPLFSGYFDTRVGAKRETESYQNIAEQLILPPQDLLFLSDIRQELDAARLAGWHTCQLIRDDADELSDHLQVNRFDQIALETFL